MTTPNISLWRYKENTRNYSGYHITANAAGCDKLIQALQTASAGKTRSAQRFALSPPTPEILAVPNNKGGKAAFVALTQLSIEIDPALSRAHMEFTESHPTLFIRASAQQAECLTQGISDIKAGKGDYCIGGNAGAEIWFWWFPQNR